MFVNQGILNLPMSTFAKPGHLGRCTRSSKHILRLHRPDTSQDAFTRLELLVVLATLTLLATVVLPATANPRQRSERVTCVNNLRQIGQAIHLWANDHDDRVPWWTPAAEGGTCALSGMPTPPWAGMVQNVWFHFAWVSNQLASPRLLACPSDTGARIASEWSTNPQGGFLHPNYLNNSVSYLIGLHCYFDVPGSLMAADKNVKNYTTTGCAMGVKRAATYTAPFGNAAWGTDLHSESGNYLSCDGQVQQLASAGLGRALADGQRGMPNTTVHILLPPR